MAIAATVRAARWISQHLPGDSQFYHPDFLADTSLPGPVSHSCALSLIYSVETTIPRKAQITEPVTVEEQNASDWGLSRNMESSTLQKPESHLRVSPEIPAWNLTPTELWDTVDIKEPSTENPGPCGTVAPPCSWINFANDSAISH